MGIEELERLVAEGIKSGLKGAELRRWVDGERAKLKAEREAKYEAEKEAQEREKQLLIHQLAALEELKKRRAIEPAVVTDAAARHISVEDTATSGSAPHFPTADMPVHASRGGFMNRLEKELKVLINDQGQSRSEEQTLIPQSNRTQPRTVAGNLQQSSLLLVDRPVLPKIKLNEGAADTGAAVSQQSKTSLSTVPNENGASTNGFSDLKSKHPQRKPQLPVQATEKHQRECKFKKTPFLTMGAANRKGLQTNRSRRFLRRKISLPYLSKRSRQQIKASIKTLRKIRSAGLQPQQWPRHISFPTGQPIFPMHPTRHSYSRIRMARPGKKDTRGPCVSKSTDWLSMRPSRLMLHGQPCWKYRKKAKGQNRSASHGLIGPRTG